METIDVQAVCDKWWERKIKAFRGKRKTKEEQAVRWCSYDKVREVLRANPDGLTAKEIAEMTHRTHAHMANTLKNMPDIYIDRWVRPNRPGPWAAVWCIVNVPPNCPKPETKCPPRKSKQVAASKQQTTSAAKEQ